MAKVREQRGRKDIALHVRHIDQRTRHTTLKRESCESHDAERKEKIGDNIGSDKLTEFGEKQ